MTADGLTLERRTELLYDRLSNEACGHCLYGLPINCTCPTRQDHEKWLAEYATAHAIEVLEGLQVWARNQELRKHGVESNWDYEEALMDVEDEIDRRIAEIKGGAE